MSEEFEVRPHHSPHPDFMSWLLTTTPLDLQIRANEVERQLHALQNHRHRQFATLYATLRHITWELEIRANRIMTRRFPPVGSAVLIPGDQR